jgi:hypothetical protein
MAGYRCNLPVNCVILRRQEIEVNYGLLQLLRNHTAARREILLEVRCDAPDGHTRNTRANTVCAS